MIIEPDDSRGRTDPWSPPPSMPADRPHSHIALHQRESRLGQTPVTVLLTGLTGSGKATIAYALEEKLFDRGHLVTVLHGQELRRGITSDLGFTADDRSENLRRTAEMARIINEAGLICVCALVAPHAAVREKVRRLIGPERFLEIYLSAPLEVCRARDTSGIYRLAERGQVKGVAGMSTQYEPPTAPDLELPTHVLTVDQSVDRIVELLRERQFLKS